MTAPVARADRARRSAVPRQVIAPLLLVIGTLGLILAAAQLARPGVDLAVADPAASRVLVRLYGLERNGVDTFRWTQPLAGLFLYGFDGRPAIATLRLTAPRQPESPPVVVAARAGERPLGSFVVAQGWRQYRILAPTRPAGETALLLEMPPFTPAGDPRELGLAISHARLAPTGTMALPPPVRLLFLLTLPLLGWLLLHRLAAPPWSAVGIGAILALVAAWAAAEPTTSGYWLPTLGWPAWPFLPLLLLAAWPRLGPLLATATARRDALPALGWVGLSAAFAAVVAMRLGLPWPLGMSLLALGVWGALGLTRGQGNAKVSVSSDRVSRPPLLRAPVLLLGVLFVALFLRLVNLDGQPAGLWRDESRHGLQALQIWSDPSYRPIYVVEGADLPALLFYLMAPVLGLLGPHAWSVRLVSALIGALTPLALYWAGAPLLGRRAALLAAALLAWASWGLSMSRWAFPATLDHLLLLTAVGFVWRCVRATGPRAIGGMALAGLLGGLAVYAYHTGRVAPLALLAVAAIRLGASFTAWRRAAPGLAAAALAGAITIAPLAAYILGDLDGYNRRVGSVSILDSNDPNIHTPAELLLRNLSRYLLMFHVQGDGNGRHHMPDAPMFDPFAGLFLAVGVGLALANLRRPGVAAVLALGAVYLIPALFSGNAPHAMRSLGTLAPAMLLSGLGLAALGTRGHGEAGTPRPAIAGQNPATASRSFVPGRSSVTANLHPATLIPLVLIASLAFNSWLYFAAMRLEPAVYGEFDLLETVAGRVAAAPARAAEPELRAVRVFLPEGLRQSDTVRFLTWGVETNSFTGAALPALGDAIVVLPADASPEDQTAALRALGPTATALGSVAHYPGGERPLAIAFGRGTAATRLIEELRR